MIISYHGNMTSPIKLLLRLTALGGKGGGPRVNKKAPILADGGFEAVEWE
jgi:hypothetical protein